MHGTRTPSWTTLKRPYFLTIASPSLYLIRKVTFFLAKHEIPFLRIYMYIPPFPHSSGFISRRKIRGARTFLKGIMNTREAFFWKRKKKKKKERRGKERSWFLVRISLDSCTQGRDFWDELIAAMGFLDLLRSGLSRRNCPDNFSSIFPFRLLKMEGWTLLGVYSRSLVLAIFWLSMEELL